MVEYKTADKPKVYRSKEFVSLLPHVMKAFIFLYIGVSSPLSVFTRTDTAFYELIIACTNYRRKVR